MEAHWQKILENDDYLLYQLSLHSGELTFVRTNPEVVRTASFLDGRFEDFHRNDVLSVPLEFALEWYRNLEPLKYAARLIFHVSFCGSTLLSRALESKSSLSYKEPLALTNLEADMRQRDVVALKNIEQRELLGLTLSQYCKSKTELRYVIKPSNLVNAIAPDICSQNAANRAIFLSMQAKAFLVAVLRGGTDRINYILRLKQNLRSYFPGYSAFQQYMATDGKDDLTIWCRDILLIHAMQEYIFSDAQRRLSEGNYYQLNYEQLVNAPVAELKNCSSALNLGLSEDQLHRSHSKTFVRHSKAPDLEYSAGTASDVDDHVIQHYDAYIKEAMDWYSKQNFELLR